MDKEKSTLIRKLSYRKQIHWVGTLTKYALVSMSIALIISFGLYSLTEVFNELVHVNIEFILISWGLFFAFVFIEYFSILRPLKHKNIELYEDKLVVCVKGNEKHLYFEKISQLKCKNGYFILKFKNNQSHSFSFAIERCDYILEQINKKRPDLFKKNSFMNLRKSIVLSDHSVARFYDLFHGSYKSYTLTYLLIFPLFLTLIVVLKQYFSDNITLSVGYVLDLIATNYLVFIIIGLSFPMITNYLFNKIKSSELDLDYKNKYRDLKYEKKVYTKLSPIYLGIILAISVVTIKYDLNLVGMITLQDGSNVYVKNKYINKKHFNYESNINVVFYDLNTKTYKQGLLLKENGRSIASELVKVQLKNGTIEEIKINQIKGDLIGN